MTASFPTARTGSAAALAAAAALALGGCTAAPTFPADGLALSNCGFPVVISEPPERVVTIKSTSAEMLLALGLGDRIVGAAFLDGPLPEEWADVELPVIAERVPSAEAVLELEPDFVYAGWESNLTADAAGDREELAELGIASYVSPAACQTAEQPEKLEFDEVFREIEEIGTIFGIDASPLIAEQRAALDAIEPDERGLTALWWSSGTETPYVGAGIGAPQMVLEAVGLENIAGSLPQTWSSLGWEAVIEEDPDVIVLVDASWNTVEHKIEYLESTPTTSGLTAVINHRYLVVPFAASEAGVRSVEAAASLAEQLAELDLP